MPALGGRRMGGAAAVVAGCLLLAGCSASPAASDNGTVTTYTLPDLGGHVPRANGIVADPSGTVWVGVGSVGGPTRRGGVDEVSPSGVVTQIPLTGAGYDGVMGPDGNVWFSETGYTGAAVLAKIDPATAGATEYTLTGYYSAAGVASGPNSDLWVVATTGLGGGGTLLEVSTAGTIVSHTPLPSSGEGVAVGADGNLWVALDNGSVERVTPSGVATNFPVAGLTQLNFAITSGPDGNLWVTSAQDAVIRMTTAGVATVFTPPNGGPNGQSPVDIVTGPDGRLWMTDAGGNISSVTTAGTIVNYPLPSSSGVPAGIARSGNTIWFTDMQAGTVSFFDPLPVISSLTPATGTVTGGQAVTVACSGCRGATAVTWNTTSITATPCPATPTAPCFTVNAAGTAVTVDDVPAGAAGTAVPVTITTPYTTSVAATYTYVGLPATVTLSAASTTITSGHSAALDVVVGATGPVPAGTVTVLGNGAALPGCSDLPLVNGAAACTPVLTGSGAVSLTASYGGDATYAGAQSAALGVTIVAAGAIPVPSTGAAGGAFAPAAALAAVGLLLCGAALRSRRRGY